jgi:3-phenylpropionate/cinnamic acid dioxygenase small subunit
MLRDRVDEIERAYKEAVEPFETAKHEISDHLLKSLDRIGATSVRTNEGLVTATVKNSAKATDAAVFMDFVAETGELDLLDRRPNYTACKDYAEEHGKPVPGVQLNSYRMVRVTKS